MVRYRGDLNKTLERGNIATIVDAARDLHQIELTSSSPMTGEIQKLARLVGTRTWPDLRTLILKYMVVPEAQFVSFLFGHSNSFRSLSMGFVLLDHKDSNAWAEELWNDAFQPMSAIPLNELFIREA